MKTLKSIFRIYGIEKALINDKEKLQIVIIKKNKNIEMNRWINLINSLKYQYRKEVEFLSDCESNNYCNLDDFILVEVNNYE